MSVAIEVMFSPPTLYSKLLYHKNNYIDSFSSSANAVVECKSPTVRRFYITDQVKGEIPTGNYILYNFFWPLVMKMSF